MKNLFRTKAAKAAKAAIHHLTLGVLCALCASPFTGRAADVKISALTALTTAASGDLLPIVDISDLSSAASGTTKKITIANFSLSLTPTWANIASKPTTLNGAGITGGATLDTLGGLTQTGTGNLVRATAPTVTGLITDTIAVSGMTTATGGITGGVQALSGAGAVNVTTLSTALTTTGGAQALTLADGVNGQIKTIAHDVDGGSAVLTPTTKTGFSTVTFTAVGETVTLQFFTTRGWMILSAYGATVAP